MSLTRSRFRKSFIAFAALLVGVCNTPAVAAADAPARSSSELDALVRQAIDHAPTLTAQRARAASAREQIDPAGALPDPMVGAMYQSMGPPWAPMAPMSMAQVEFSQAFPGVGKRSARRTAARAEAAARQAEVQSLRAELARAVRVNYANVYAIDAQRDALEAGKQLVAVLLAAVTGRYTSGQLDQEALIRMQLEQSSIDEELTDLAAQRAAVVASINQLAAREQSARVGPVKGLPNTTLDVRNLSDRAVKGAPELSALRAQIAAASARVNAAQTETRPNWYFSLAGGATTGGDPIITLRAGMELPLWSGSKQEPLVRAASNDVDAARADLDAAELRLRQTIAELVARWKRDNEQVKRYRDVIVPQTARALDAARAGYATGRTDFSTLIEDFRRWIDSQLGLVRRESEQYATWAELQALLDAGGGS